MPQVLKTCIICVLAIALAVSSFYSPAFASSIAVSSPLSLNHLASLPSPEEVSKIGKIVLRVTPKVADKLAKKYGRKLVKVLPGVGTALTVIEISVDIYQDIEAELKRENSSSDQSKREDSNSNQSIS